MATVGELIERIQRTWLEPADDQPTRFTLDGSLTDSATTLTYDPAFLTAEEADLLAGGTVIEIGTEQVIVGAVDESANTLSDLVRGANGTTKAAHDDNDEVIVSPAWPRQAVLEALADTVMGLWPELYAVAQSSEIMLSTATFTEVDAVVEKPLWFWLRTGGAGSTNWAKVGVTFFDQFPPSSTGKAIQVRGRFEGGTGYLVYRRRFVRPTAETDDLQSDVLLDEEWERLVEVATVAHLVGGRDLDAVSAEHLSDQLAAQGVPVGTGQRVREGLLRYEQFLRQQAKRTLLSRYPTPVVRGGRFT